MRHTRLFSFGLAFVFCLTLAVAPRATGQDGASRDDGAGAISDLTPVPSVVEKVPTRGESEVPARVERELPSVKATPAQVTQQVAAPVPLYDDKSLNNALFLLDVQRELKQAYKEYRDLNVTIQGHQKQVDAAHDEISSLRDQIITLQKEINISELKINNVAEQVGLREKELSILQREVMDRSVAFDEQKILLADYMRLLYLQESRFSGSNIRGDISTAKLLLADAQVGDTLNEMFTLDMLQQRGQTMLDTLQGTQEAITEMQRLILDKKAGLDHLQEKLIAERQHLKHGQEAKASLVQATHGEQKKYEKLITESLRQQEEAAIDIAALQSNFDYVKDNLSRLGKSVTAKDLQVMLDQRTREIYEFQQQSDGGALFAWPVKPSRGISAYFHDSAYRARFGVGHQAIDIPTYQSSKIFAPKDGFVYKIKDNGMGYSYIILSHRNSLMTLYGHVSSILVQEGQFVRSGDVIGLSGGMIGAKGSGYMTTGPHLHFEVIRNGKHVDPLDYLSLTKLPLNSLPHKYARRVEEQRIVEIREEIGKRENGDTTNEATSNDVADDRDTVPDRDAPPDPADYFVPEESADAAERSEREEIEAYRRIFGIPEDSANVKP